MTTAPTPASAPGEQTPSSAPSATTGDTGSTAMWSVPAYFLGGVLMLGLPGWALDRWLGTSAFVAVGVLAGVTLAMYVIWVRYVGSATAAGADTTGGARPARSDEESA